MYPSRPPDLVPTADRREERPSRCWLRVQAAAEHLGIGTGTLNKLRCHGGGPPYSKLGHVVVYDARDLDTWAKARKVGRTSEPVRLT